MTSLNFSGEQAYLAFGDGQPFGHELIQFETEYAVDDPTYVGEQTFLLGAYKQALKLLARSRDSDDERRVRIIDRASFDGFDDPPPWKLWQLKPQPDLVTFLSRQKLETIAAFARNNVLEQPYRQDQLEDQLPEMKERLVVGVENLLKSGLVDKNIESMYKCVINLSGRIIASDAFDVPGYLAAGYCTSSGIIHVSPTQFSAVRDQPTVSHSVDTLFHEHVHALGTHYGSGFLFNKVDQRLLEEVMASHCTVSALYPVSDPIDFMPDEIEEHSSYNGERQLLAGLARTLPEAYLFEMFRDAYYSCFPVQQMAMKGLLQALDEATRQLIPKFTSWESLNTQWSTLGRHKRSELIKDILQQVGLTKTGGSPDIGQTVAVPAGLGAISYVLGSEREG